MLCVSFFEPQLSELSAAISRAKRVTKCSDLMSTIENRKYANSRHIRSHYILRSLPWAWRRGVKRYFLFFIFHFSFCIFPLIHTSSHLLIFKLSNCLIVKLSNCQIQIAPNPAHMFHFEKIIILQHHWFYSYTIDLLTYRNYGNIIDRALLLFQIIG